MDNDYFIGAFRFLILLKSEIEFEVGRSNLQQGIIILIYILARS